MRLCRFLPLLILCCALDLAVPVAPTAHGVEFEEDEEVIHIVPKPLLARAVADVRQPRWMDDQDLRRPRLPQPSMNRTRPQWLSDLSHVPLVRGDDTRSLPPPGEDH